MVGINYFNTPTAKLNGPITDVHKMVAFISACGFQNAPQSMLILTDDQQDPTKQPTKANILAGMQWLVSGAQPGDSLFFHYSGHGSQVLDQNGDEADGKDETILACDFKQTGHIVDDQIFELLVKPLPAGVRLTSVMDCCHSGTGMDLPYTFAANANQQPQPAFYFRDFKKAHKMRSGMTAQPYISVTQDGTKYSYGDAVLFSGCRDDQTAADVSVATSYGTQAGGAMTNAFLAGVAKAPNQSYAQVLFAMRDNLNGGGSKSYSQIPQLSTSRNIDMNQVFAI